MQTGPLAGYVPDFSEYVLGPVPLPEPVPPGISVQALGTFGFQLTNLELAPPETHDAVVLELGSLAVRSCTRSCLASPLAGRALPWRWSAPVSSRPIHPKRPDLQLF